MPTPIESRELRSGLRDGALVATTVSACGCVLNRAVMSAATGTVAPCCYPALTCLLSAGLAVKTCGIISSVREHAYADHSRQRAFWLEGVSYSGPPGLIMLLKALHSDPCESVSIVACTVSLCLYTWLLNDVGVCRAARSHQSLQVSPAIGEGPPPDAVMN